MSVLGGPVRATVSPSSSLLTRRRLRASRGGTSGRRGPCAVRAEAAKAPREPWDFGRFARTLVTFQPPPEIVAAPLRVLMGVKKPELSAGRNGLGILGGTWPSLDDVVMGGVSDSKFEVEAGASQSDGPARVFRGTVSESNNGGFASCRSAPNWEPPLDWTGAAGLELRLRGDGNRYKLSFRSEPGWDTACYSANVDTTKGEWEVVRVPFGEFEHNFRAKRLAGLVLGPQSNALRTVYNMQLMLSKFGLDDELNPKFSTGPFELPVASLKLFYAGADDDTTKTTSE